MKRIPRIVAYLAAIATMLVALVSVGLNWAPIETNYRFVFYDYYRTFALAAGFLMLGGGLLNKWEEWDIRSLIRVIILPFGIALTLIGLGANGDSEPLWEWSSLVWFVFLTFSAAEYVRFARR